MNINEDIRNKRGKSRKMKRYAHKISYISAARCSILPIWYQINAKTEHNLFNSLLIVLDN